MEIMSIREMVLVRIKSAASDRSQVLAAADIFRGKIIDVAMTA